LGYYSDPNPHFDSHLEPTVRGGYFWIGLRFFLLIIPVIAPWIPPCLVAVILLVSYFALFIYRNPFNYL